jgi:hypothetical protein
MNEIIQESPHVDAIICWPKSTDYPLFREFIKTHRDFFNKVIIVFTETNQGENYRLFVREAMAEDGITFLENREVQGDDDWRNLAVNLALEHSDTTWVWFMEQDLLVTSPAFWPFIARQMLDHDAIGWKDGSTRLHPACLLVKRSSINATHKNFGIVPGKLDHFARFWTSLRLSGAKVKQIPYPNELFYHMNGLSHNMALAERGEEVTYKPEEFYPYLALCLAQETLHPSFKAVAQREVKKYMDAQE